MSRSLHRHVWISPTNSLAKRDAILELVASAESDKPQTSKTSLSLKVRGPSTPDTCISACGSVFNTKFHLLKRGQGVTGGD